MKNLFYNVRKQLSKIRRVKAIVGSNLAFAMLATSIFPTSSPFAKPAESLVIPPISLVKSFDLKTEPAIQIPVDFRYVSQSFHLFHPGVDLAGEIGLPIKPITDGTVVEIEHFKFDYGNMVLIDHGNGLESLYAHLFKINVKVNDEVTLDTVIGEMGSTGHSTGPHLHLEIHQDGRALNPISIIPDLVKPRVILSQS